jgi:hypothetical protein
MADEFNPSLSPSSPLPSPRFLSKFALLNAIVSFTLSKYVQYRTVSYLQNDHKNY